MNNIRIIIKALVNPTEDNEKVAKAIKEIFGEVKTAYEKVKERPLIVSELNGLEELGHLRYILARDRIRNTTRRVLTHLAEDERLYFELNRQAAYSGHFSFYHEKESPLGPIEVDVKGDIDRFINYLCG